jgi:hypothetical protein
MVAPPRRVPARMSHAPTCDPIGRCWPPATGDTGDAGGARAAGAIGFGVGVEITLKVNEVVAVAGAVGPTDRRGAGDFPADRPGVLRSRRCSSASRSTIHPCTIPKHLAFTFHTKPLLTRIQ